MRQLLSFSFVLFAFLSVGTARAAPPADRPTPGYVRVRMVTSEGPLVIAVDTKRAPKTGANFLAYVDDGRFDGTSFYRAARRKTDPKLGFVQGGIDSDRRRALPPVPHEPTSQTGLTHGDATVSMARSGPGTAMGDFFIMVGAVPSMDARPGSPGYAAFGHVVAGMGTVRKILAKPTSGGTGAMRGQMIDRPVQVISVKRIDGTPKPTPGPKPWLIQVRR